MFPQLKIHNSMSRAKEDFAPIDPKNVRMYVCGPTVYDFIHIGNARPIVVFDLLYRLLRRLYGEGHVTYVRNITDVDDKINARAQEEGVEIAALTARTAEAFHQDIATLNALPPDVEPRATDHIAQMIAMMESLIEKGHAYAAEGHVLFSVPSMADYGQLSRLNRDELIAGARVDVAPYKQDPADFVLWKPSPPELPGWESPWGRGRPGWHIECSAMAAQHLGETFDIHGGGIDLVFPHHENELAQSRCAHGGTPFVRYWMHNGYVVVGGEKMSKSLGNFTTLRALLEEGLRGEAIRLALLSGHYRAPLDLTRDKIRECEGQLDRLYGALRAAGGPDDAAVESGESGEGSENAGADNAGAEIPDGVMAALTDDLNTPLALAELHELATALNSAGAPAEKARLQAQLRAAGRLMGLLQQDPEAWFQGAPASADDSLTPAAIEDLIAQRKAARAAKDFAEADRIRDELKDSGVILEDGAAGTSWKRAR